jgi:hypothetical protein
LPSSCYCWRSTTSWGLVLFSHRSASRIFIMQPGCSSPPVVTQNDDRQPCGGEERAGPWPPPALSFKDVHHSCWGGGKAELVSRLSHGLATHFFLQHSGEKGVHQPYGGGELPLAAWSGCGCPSTVWATVTPCADQPRPQPFPRRRLHRGVVQDVVLRRGGVLVLGQSCPRSCGEDGSKDLLVHARAAAIRRCGVGAALVRSWPLPSVLRWWPPQVRLPTTEGVASIDETVSATCGRTSGSLALMACSRPS